MVKQSLREMLSQEKSIQEWHRISEKKTRQLITGLSSTTKALVMATALEQHDKIMVVTPSQNEAEKVIADLTAILGEEKVYNFFTDDVVAAEFLVASQDKIYSRLEVLQFLLDKKKKGIVVASLQAIRLFLPSKERYQSALYRLTVGMEIDPVHLLNHIKHIGYQKVDRVLSQGECALRGDILDVFPMDSVSPYRIEFFGDEIDGIRVFDPDSQLSLEQVSSVNLSAATDLLVDSEDFQRGSQRLMEVICQSVDKKLTSYLQEILADWQQGILHQDSRFFQSLLYEKSWTLLDYLPASMPIFFDEFQHLTERHAKMELELADYVTHRLQESKALPNLQYLAPIFQELRHYKPATFFSHFKRGLGNLSFDNFCQFQQQPVQSFFNQIPLLVEEIRHYQKMRYTIVLQAETEKTLDSLQGFLQEYGCTLEKRSSDEIVKHESQLVLGHLSSGFALIEQALVVITEWEIFQKKVKRRMRRQVISNAERLKDYQELEKGDFVVHQVHGIGQYLGIETIEISGIHRDYVNIAYQNGDRISLPVDQLDALSKYIASDGKTPKLNKLNDGRFARTRHRVEKQVEDIAEDLIALYAARSQLKGFAFSPDDAAQEEFDQAFLHVETEDQLRSIEEIKRDMEKTSPMDRLLVGDVGFGKTEVAMRAAFKAVNDHKQVAILVPTTVLAQQHFANFQARFADFAVNVAVLSRFQTKAEQTAILERLKKGQVDILIGTHRLLSKDVVFADLGLLVIDEEQRFGVKHKETLKEIKQKIDVLTLTATPIPRTLHMSMLGIRDLSVIETPPTNRYPVQTYIMETNPSLIREAVLREMDRGGQAYYLYNKVDTIEQKVSELQDLIPEASIGYIHGQLSEIQLENTLIAFIEGEYDLLVTTTIIETGVDIPNANTLFIEDADKMGLSTLYQLRGRVGRTNRLAYAYLMYRPDKSLTEIAEKRLEAIKGFTELGSGFKIAMRDLSIRGAGNLLGASQSGFIDSVGYELYSQLLEEAIAKKQGKNSQRRKSNAEISLQIDAYLPSDYIADERQKIEIYKRIRSLDSRVNYELLQDELIDRFGEYPDVVAYLVEIGLLKFFMDQAFVAAVERKADTVIIRFEAAARLLYLTQDYFEALSKTSLKARIAEQDGSIQVIFDIRHHKDYQILENLIQFAEHLQVIRFRKEETGMS